ncbi:MAG: glycosyltransferase family protein [bacterium]|nr:glycosyltransferase family protein [bacterium]
MANIIYGINGEGSGHWTRSREVVTYLQKSGHSVIIVASGQASANLKDGFRVEDIFGFRFEFKDGRVDGLATFLKNTSSFSKGAKSLHKTLGFIKKEKVDLVITDFEPVSCLAGRIGGIPVVSIDNQHFISRTDADYPRPYSSQARITKTAIEMMTRGADVYLALSFFDAEPKDDSTFTFPPIVRREVFYLDPKEGDYVLVYVTHGHKGIAEVLKTVDFRFVVYGTGDEEQDGNITFRKFNSSQFLKDLAGSAGVIATAGFSLISEALFLGKPYLAWPVKNQFEQTFNAYHLERLGYGKFVSELGAEKIESFLFNLEGYRQNLLSYNYQHEGNDKLFANLNRLIEKLV